MLHVALAFAVLVGSQVAPVELDGARTPREGSDHTRRTLYLNRYGGSYTMGSPNDAASNISSVGAGTIPPFGGTDAEWTQLVTCTRLMFDRFSLEITEDEPTGQHIEAVVGGRAAMIGQTTDWGGYAPLPDCANPTIESSIVFVFSEQPGLVGDMQTACEVLAQEAAHALGLDHEYLCEDPMTYREGCQPKTFQNVAAPCGEYAEQACRCGGTVQNSVQLLLERLGPADAEPPTVTVTSPADGAQVPIGFEVLAEAQDNDLITKVELLVDGVYQVADNAPPYRLSTPRSIGPGLHTIDVRAYDNGANRAAVTLMLTVVADCAVDADCAAADQTCAGGACLGTHGAGCEENEDCATSLCAEPAGGGDPVCTSYCSGPDAAACPAGTSCVAPVAGFSKCFPAGAGGCGCHAPGGTGGGAGGGAAGAGAAGAIAAGVFFVLAAFARRQRRARRL